MSFKILNSLLFVFCTEENFTHPLHDAHFSNTRNSPTGEKLHGLVPAEDYHAQFEELKDLIECAKLEILEKLVTDTKTTRRHLYTNHTQVLDALNQLTNQNLKGVNVVQPKVTLTNVDVFPGSNDDYLQLIPLISKTTKCNNCSTCQKNEICVFKTYEVLKSIVSSYPDWSPPGDIPARPVLNPLLLSVLKNISDNVNNTDLVYLVWSTDQKLRHLINPLFLASLKLPAKGQKGRINPALFIALSQGNLDPMSMMALMGDEFDPIYLALMGGDVDPMTLALLKDKNIDPLLLSTLLNKKTNQQPSGCSGAQRRVANERNQVPQRSQRLGNTNALQDLDPNLLLLLSGNGGDNDMSMAFMLMNLLKGRDGKTNGAASASCSKNGNEGLSGAKTNPVVTNRYGRVEDVSKDDEKPVGSYNYGKGYGR